MAKPTAGTRKGAVSSDPIMDLWPMNLDKPYDICEPYPCCTCGVPFKSRKSLRTHPCKGGKRFTPSNTPNVIDTKGN